MKMLSTARCWKKKPVVLVRVLHKNARTLYLDLARPWNKGRLVVWWCCTKPLCGACRRRPTWCLKVAPIFSNRRKHTFTELAKSDSPESCVTSGSVDNIMMHCAIVVSATKNYFKTKYEVDRNKQNSFAQYITVKVFQTSLAIISSATMSMSF